MFVITVLRVAVARAFTIVIPERFLGAHLEVEKRYDRHGNSSHVRKYPGRRQRPVAGTFQENLQVLRP